MRKLGFKLFSNNLKNLPQLVDDAVVFVKENIADMYIELMALPSTSSDEWKLMKQKFAGLPVTIHAPHNGMGFDTGYKDKLAQNVQILSCAQRAADLFGSEIIVVHAGGGNAPENLEETARQFKLFNDKRIVVENLPYEASDVNGYMHGNTPEQIKQIMDYAGCGFCFDFSHAVCAANSLKLDLERQLKGFYELNPTVYHLCDGLTEGTEDEHRHYGEGNFPLKKWLQDYVAEDAWVTMETGEGIPSGIQDWINDFNYLHKL